VLNKGSRMACVSPELINAIRVEVGDTDPSIPMLHDDEIAYLLNKQNGSVRRASLDAARVLLFKLSMQSEDSQVGIISIKGSKVASEYRESLKLYLNNPNLSPMIDGLGSYIDSTGKTQNPIYAGGISISDMQSNTSNTDNNYIPNPIYQKSESPPFVGPFSA